MVQVKISAAIVFTIFFLLTLILRSTGALQRRLTLATDQFKSGDYSVRMQVKGTSDARAMASTFNAMAQEVQTLVQSLLTSERQQRDQLHFTQQLINAFPVPLFVENTSGICMRVNMAWEHLFRVNAASLVGKPVQEIFNSMQLLNAQGSPFLQVGGDFLAEQELHVVTPDGQALDVLYWQAAFTTSDGEAAGKICAMVDITLRRRAQAALRAEKERAEVTLSSIGDAVITTDLLWRIESINTVAQQLTGWNSDLALGSPLEHVFELMDIPGQAPLGPKWSDVLAVRTVVHATN
jgi:PAS domain S-box-containing protein